MNWNNYYYAELAINEFLYKEVTYNPVNNLNRYGGFPYYKGKTIQVIPHVTNKIKEKIYNIINFEQPDFLLIEIGGTVGDAE